LGKAHKFNTALSANLNLYHYKTKDMIEFVASPSGASIAQNHKNLTGKGIELETLWKVSEEWSITANYAYQSTENDLTHKQVEYVPKRQFYIDTRWKIADNWELSSQINWVADRERAMGDPRSDIADYTLVNLSLRRTNFSFGNGDRTWEFAALVKNLFDENAFEPSNGSIPDDYPLHERQLYIELRYNL